MSSAPIPDALLETRRAAHQARSESLKARLAAAFRLVSVAVLIAVGLRTFAYEPFNIPSESMQPGLLVGDYLFVAKWPYGYSRYSLPMGPPILEGRVFGALPRRGDVIVFKTPRDNRTDYIKRAIGLPGDTVAMVHGQIVLNGTMIPRARRDDAVLQAGGGECEPAPGRPDFRTTDASGRQECRYPAFVETLPGGRHFDVIDQIANDVRDNFGPVRVPAGHVFVLGDNRDDSADSRFTLAEGGVGMVPTANIIGRADRIFFSVDPGARLSRPAGWAAALRRDRIGMTL